jgi:hypothetical protein
MTIAALGAALISGVLIGVFSFKVKARWCGLCGATLACPDCAASRRAFCASATHEERRVAAAPSDPLHRLVAK